MELNSLSKWAEENITNEPGEVYLGKEEITKYEQVHLAVAYSNGISNNYMQNARMKMAREAAQNGCLSVVDGDDCQNDPKKGQEIFAGTGLRLKYDKSLEGKISLCNFAKLRLSHIDKVEFLRRMGEDSENFTSVPIHVKYEGTPDEDYLAGAEIKLSKKAMQQGFVYVTNMDYVSHHPELRVVAISAEGLLLKKKE